MNQVRPIAHVDAGAHIQALQARIATLLDELATARRDNRTLTALYCQLPAAEAGDMVRPGCSSTR